VNAGPEGMPNKFSNVIARHPSEGKPGYAPAVPAAVSSAPPARAVLTARSNSTSQPSAEDFASPPAATPAASLEKFKPTSANDLLARHPQPLPTISKPVSEKQMTAMVKHERQPILIDDTDYDPALFDEEMAPVVLASCPASRAHSSFPAMLGLKDKWSCSECTYINPASRLACEMCDGQRQK
jgi:hypothetical protein